MLFVWSAFVCGVRVVCVRGGVHCGCVHVGLCALWVGVGGVCVHFRCGWYVHVCVVCDVCYNRDVKGWHKVYRASAIGVPHFLAPLQEKNGNIFKPSMYLGQFMVSAVLALTSFNAEI